MKTLGTGVWEEKTDAKGPRPWLDDWVRAGVRWGKEDTCHPSIHPLEKYVLGPAMCRALLVVPRKPQ